MKFLSTEKGRQILFYLFITSIWQFISIQKIWPPYLFPSPHEVFLALISGLSDKSLIIAVAISLKRIFYGYGFSVIAGIIIGLLMSKNKFLREVLNPFFLGMGTLPSICWLPLGLLWFGLNEKAIFFVIVMGAIFSIIISVDAGIRNIPQIYLNSALTMGAGGLNKYVYVILPAALPSFVSGAKLGWTFAWRSLMAGELLFVSLGLGHLLMMGRELNDINQIITVMFVIIFIGVIIDRYVFGILEKNIRKRWGIKN